MFKIVQGISLVYKKERKLKNQNSLFLVLVVVLSTLLVPAPSLAATPGPFVSVTVGQFKAKAFDTPSSIEKQILSDPRITSSRTVDGKSVYNEIGVGYCPNTYICAGLSYTSGVRVKMKTTVSGWSGGTVNINNTTYTIGSSGTNMAFERDGEASAILLSMSGEYMFQNHFAPYAKIGMYHWKANVVDKLSVGNSGVYLAYNETLSGKDPMASIGVKYYFTPKFAGGVGILKTGKLQMISAEIRYSGF